jgi:hypothetical protein
MGFNPEFELAGLFGLGQEPADDILSARAMMHLLECVIAINCDYLDVYPNTPLLLGSGVVYYFDKGNDRFRNIRSILETMTADCDGIVCYRVAELRRKFGIMARPTFTRKVTYNPVSGRWKQRFHILTAMPNGTTEDTSKLLGMS